MPPCLPPTPRRSLKPGDLLLTRSNDPFGILVRLVTEAPVNHVAIVAENGLSVIEAVTPRVRRAPLPPRALVLPAPDAEAGRRVAAIAATHVGEPYALLIDAALGVRLLTHLQLPLPAVHGTICSALAVACWRAAGLELLGGRDPRAITPADLLVEAARRLTAAGDSAAPSLPA